MRRFIMENTNRFSLVSYGKGTAYALNQKPSNDLQHDGLQVFVQGDDALQFESEWESICNVFPNDNLDKNLARLWDIYSEVAEPWSNEND